MKLSYLSILLIILFPILLFFFTRGIAIHDEGYILHSSERFLNGSIPYRDFNFEYTPGSLFLTSASFLILGNSILSARILMISIAILASFLIFKIVYLSTKNNFYSVLTILIFIAWGPTHINSASPVMFVISATLLTCYLILKFLETRKDKYLFFGGLGTFSIYAIEQNFGGIIIIPIVIFFLTKNVRKIKYPLTFLCGYLWGIIGFISYLVATDSFRNFVFDFYPSELISILKIQVFIQFPYPVRLFFTSVHISLFYLIPFIISFMSLIILYIRRRFHLLFLPIIVISYYIVEMGYAVDFVHISPILSLTGIPIALFLRYNIHSFPRASTILLSIVLIVLGIYTALFKDYITSNTSIIYNNAFFSNPKVSIFLDTKSIKKFSEIIEFVDKYTSKNDYVYVNSSNYMLHFVIGRNDPIRHNFPIIQAGQKNYYDEVLGNLIAKNVKILILDQNIPINSSLNKYIHENYSLNKKVENLNLFIKD